MPRQLPASADWAQEFAALKPALRAYLVRRGLGWLVDDVLSKVAVELASKPEQTWSDAADDRAGLIWRIVKFRARDEMRSHFVKKAAALEPDELLASDTAEGAGADVASRADARRLLRVVARLVDALPVRDRELVTRDLDSEGGVEALTSKERVQLLRLRRALASRALAELGKGRQR